MISTTLMGGCGNNFFQIAMCIAHAIKYNLEYCIPMTIENPHYSDPNQHVFPNIKYSNGGLLLPKFNEQQFLYNGIPFIDNVCFLGYWQSYKYFDDYRDDIINAFGFGNIVTIPDVCALHYRAGDYKKYPTVHPIVSREYIGAAISKMWFDGYKRFYVFSDEISEIKEIIKSFHEFDDLEFEYSEGRSAIEDLRLMASCGSHIMSNSTFSWWAHYLSPNPSKLAIAPAKWFGAAMPHYTKDLMMPHFTII